MVAALSTVSWRARVTAVLAVISLVAVGALMLTREAPAGPSTAAQSGPNGTITGRVTQLGVPVAGAQVSATDYVNPVFTTTDDDGYYSLSVPPSSYYVQFTGVAGSYGEAFNDAPTYGGSRALLPVASGATLAGIDADLGFEATRTPCSALDGWCLRPLGSYTPCFDVQLSGPRTLELAGTNAAGCGGATMNFKVGDATASGAAATFPLDGPGPFVVEGCAASAPQDCARTRIHADVELLDPLAAVTGPAGLRLESDGATSISMANGSRSDITIEVNAYTFCVQWLGAIPSVMLGGNTYPMSAGQYSFVFTATIPAASVAAGDLTIDISCGIPKDVPTTIARVQLFDPSGYVTNAITGDPVQGATVVLYQVPGWSAKSGPADNAPDTCESNASREGAPWSQPAPTELGQVVDPGVTVVDPLANPLITDAEGYYGWDVPAGCWYVVVSKPGYETLTSPVVGVPTEVTDLDLELGMNPLPTFRDVPPSNPFYGSVTWMAAKGVTTGRPDKTYAPNASVSRQEMAAFLYRYAGSPPISQPCREGSGNPGGTGSTVVEVRPFTDVAPTNPFCNAITWMKESGTSTGYSDGTYRPAQTIGRGEMAAFMYRLAGNPPGPFPNPGFTDVGTGNVFFANISWMAQSGVTQGYPDNTFRPGRNVSRAEMAAFLQRFDGLS